MPRNKAKIPIIIIITADTLYKLVLNFEDKKSDANPVTIIAGNVPKPKNNMVSIPPKILSVAAAIAPATYTKPQGMKPNTNPNPKIFLRLTLLNKLLTSFLKPLIQV